MDNETQEEVTSATDWNGRDDPDNPHNWPLWKKVYHSIIPTAFGFLCPFGSSVYTPGVMAVMVEFNVSREVALLPFVCYLLGLSLGPVLAAPMSENYGRKAVYLSAVPVSGLFTLGAGFSTNITSLIVCRFFAGALSSPGLSIGSGSIADVWPVEKRGVSMGAFMSSVQLGPALGPLIGGLVVEYESWRWTQWTILFVLVGVLSLTVGMSETYKKAILKRRAKKLGIKGPPGPEGRPLWETIKEYTQRTILRPLHMLFTEPIVTFFDLYVAVIFGLTNGFFAAFPWVFERVYGLGLVSIGLTFLGQAVGSLIGFILVVAFNRYYYTPAAARCREKDGERAKLTPEHRLFMAMVAGPMLPTALFWFGWTARPEIHWISPVAAEALFTCGAILMFTCAALYLTDCYGAIYGASAMSSNTFLRYLFAASFPLFILQMYEALGVGWATSLLGFIMVLMALIPFVFWRYGPHLRRNSKYNPGE